MSNGLHVKAEELHQAQLRLACLVTEVCMDIVDSIECSGDHGYRNYCRTRAALHNGLGLTRPDASFEHIHDYAIR